MDDDNRTASDKGIDNAGFEAERGACGARPDGGGRLGARRQADRPADRTYRLYGREHRYRGSPAGLEEVQEQAGPRLRPEHGPRPQGGEPKGARAGQKTEGHAGGQSDEPGPEA